MRIAALSCVLLAACSQAPQPPEPPVQDRATPIPFSEEDLAGARLAAATLGAALKGELQAAMQSGGAVAGIAVCKEAAPVLAVNVSDETGFTVARTALRVRNPANAPDGFERETLEDFVARAAAGEPLDTLEVHAVIDGELRYMKAIPMGAMCATCHGTDIAPEVSAELASAYPDDRATGFVPGEVRGAFTLRRPIGEAVNP